MLIVIIIGSILLAGVLWACCHLSGDDPAPRRPPAEVDAADPCEDCLRWFECNGVDLECPLRKEAQDGEE